MDSRTYKLTIKQRTMERRFLSYSYGNCVLYKTRGIWITPFSAAFFRVVAFPKNRYLVEFVHELPQEHVHNNRPRIQLGQISRLSSKISAYKLCHQKYKWLLEYQRQAIGEQKDPLQDPWHGTLIYETDSLFTSDEAIFGPHLTWAVTEAEDGRFMVYSLAFSDILEAYDWVELISVHDTREDALAVANSSYLEIAESLSEDMPGCLELIE